MKKKHQKLVGITVAIVLILTIVLGTAGNFMGAFNMNRGGEVGQDGAPEIQEMAAVADTGNTHDSDIAGLNSGFSMGIPYVQTVAFNGGELDFFNDSEIYRFKISAIDGNVTIYYLGFDFYEEGLEIEDLYITEYGDDTVLGKMSYSGHNNLIHGALDERGDGIAIMEGDDKTFSLMAALDRDHDDDYISSQTRFGSSTSPNCVGPDTYENVFDEVDFDLGMIWAPRVNKKLSDPVWMNDGCDVEGLNMALFEIERL